MSFSLSVWFYICTHKCKSSFFYVYAGTDKRSFYMASVGGKCWGSVGVQLGASGQLGASVGVHSQMREFGKNNCSRSESAFFQARN